MVPGRDGIDYNSMNDSCLFKSHKLPCFSCIQRSVYSSTTVLRISWVSFSCSYPYLSRVRRINFNSSNGKHGYIIKYRFPSNAAIVRFPYAPLKQFLYICCLPSDILTSIAVTRPLMPAGPMFSCFDLLKMIEIEILAYHHGK